MAPFPAAKPADELRRFSVDSSADLGQDRSGIAIPVDCTVTRFATRGRTLALILLRPV